MNRDYSLIAALFVAALAAPATAAQAADPGEMELVAERGWSGCYVGANVGYVQGDDDALDAPFTEGPFAGLGASWNSPPGVPYETISSDGSGAIGGIEAGCDYEMSVGGLSFVLGGVADIGVLNLRGNGISEFPDTNTSFDVYWAGSLRARMGVASPKFLLYATGGVAFAGIDVRAVDFSAVPSVGIMDVSGGGTETGWVIGGGGEWRFAQKWSVSLEYLHFNFDDIVATGPATFPVGAFPRFENDIDFDTVRVGLKFRM